MPHFTKQIILRHKIREFHFNSIFTVDGLKYHVSVKDGPTSHYFMMEKRKDKYLVSDVTKVAEWIIEIQDELGSAILEHLKSG